MSPLGPSNLTTVDTEEGNIDDAQDKGNKIAFMNTIECLKVEMNKFHQEIYENTKKSRTRDGCSTKFYQTFK